MLINFTNDNPRAHSLLYRYTAPTRWIMQPLGELASRRAADYQAAVTDDDSTSARKLYLVRLLELAMQAGEAFLEERIA